MYEPRTYRHWINDKNLVSFSAVIKETDLLIRARSELQNEALAAIRSCRIRLEEYIAANPVFAATLEPVSVGKDAPPIVKEMANAAQKAGVGPMAAVAGAIAERVGQELLCFSDEIVVENGGDIFIKTSSERIIGIYAGASPLTGRIAFSILPQETPCGICTSSGSVGHSLSFGNADAVTVISSSTALADAAATAVGNRVNSASDISTALEFAQTINGISGVAIIKNDRIGLWGKIKLAEIEE